MKSIVIWCLALILLQSAAYSQWQGNSTTLPRVISLAVRANSIYAATEKGLYLSTDNGTTWTLMKMSKSGDIEKLVTAVAVNGDNIVAGTNFEGVFHSTDNGNTWVESSIEVSNIYVQAIAYSGSNIIVAGISSADVGQLLFSTDNGKQWKSKNFGSIYKAIATNANLVVIAGDSPLISTDNGNTWVNDKLYKSTFSVVMSGSIIYFGGYGVIYRSSDNGGTWVTNKIGTGNSIVSSLVVSGNKIFAGTNGEGVFLSADNGNNWTAHNSGLPNLNVTNIAISGGRVLAFCEGANVVQANLNAFGISTVLEDNTVNNYYSLAPNPAGQYVDINCNQTGVLGSVQVLSLIGEQLLRIDNIATKHYRFDISTFPTGAYVVRIGSSTRMFVRQ